MSAENLGKALNLIDPRMTPAMRLLLVGIANHDGDGGAYPRVSTLARYVGVSERQIQKMVKQLEEMGRLKREVQTGGGDKIPPHLRTNFYLPNYENWGGELQDTGCPPVHPPGEPQFTPLVSSSSPHKPLKENPQTQPSNNPIVPGELNFEIPESKSRNQILAAQAETVYQAYPLKVAKPPAIQAILKALKKLPPDELLQRVKKYATSVRNADKKFIPHPATWFNQERWNDQPITVNTTHDYSNADWMHHDDPNDPGI